MTKKIKSTVVGVKNGKLQNKNIKSQNTSISGISKNKTSNKNNSRNNKTRQMKITKDLDDTFSTLQQARPKPATLPKGIQVMNDLETQLSRFNKTNFFN